MYRDGDQLLVGAVIFMLIILLPGFLGDGSDDVWAAPCVVPDNGTGTVALPADCPYATDPADPMMIIDGLPPGTTIEMDAQLIDFICQQSAFCSGSLPPGECEGVGGSLGGNFHCFEATLDLQVTGTGELLGFNRYLSVPAQVEIHTGPRNPGDPVQTFSAAIFRLQGELFGDPDFCLFRITAGVDFGLPSPGETELTQLPTGDFNVDSFFDITYEIEFEGCPGSQLDGYAGITTHTVRWQQGEQHKPSWQPGDDYKMHFPQLPDPEGWDINATTPAIMGDDWMCSETGWVKDIHFWGSWRDGTVGDIFSFDVSIYDNIPAGVDLPYSHPGELLWNKEITSFGVVPFNPGLWEGWFDPAEQLVSPMDHQQYFQYDIFLDEPDWFQQEEGTIYWLCISANVALPDVVHWGWKSSLDHWEDYAVWLNMQGDCVAPDNGTGTVDLPADCPYATPPDDPMMIIDGFPPGTTLEMDAQLIDFICLQGGICSGSLPPGECEGVGGSLGGNFQCFEATLDLVVTGTGDLTWFNRHLAVPVQIEIHTGPRNPGDPVQTFLADIYRMQGELFGDPDFCEFSILAGTDYGLPSPGQVTLTQLPDEDFNVDSFFDITYKIQFEGCPGSLLDGYSGTTTRTVRWQQGSAVNTEWQLAEITESPCPAPDNGTGTPTLPADCPYTSPLEVLQIIDGLPPGTTIELEDSVANFTCQHPSGLCSLPLAQGQCEMPGGTLGGDGHCFEADLDLDVTGTGDLTGFNRHLVIPIEIEIHTGQRNPGDPVQSFAADMYRMQGELFGDPDFCTFRITAGTDYGLPSPGQYTLTRLPDGNYNVDSFFDITYQIEFEGCPGSQLEDYSGTTTAAIRWIQGGPPTIDNFDLAFVITGEADVCDCGLEADVNCDDSENPLDVQYMVAFVFQDQDARCTKPDCPWQVGDVNCDNSVNPLDVQFMVQYVFMSDNAMCTMCP